MALASRAAVEPAGGSADPASVGVAPGAAILVLQAGALLRWAAAACPGAAHVWAGEVAEAEGRAETSVGVRAVGRRA
ncbi:hypothetical protein [Candidatus Mycobacterium methanotrophicum]|uniref:hypothetical protein n=1 Tax=Candidatus Mycobacterium methanotrophicum TaxID=2943498 RepID=UPI002715487E|nr:hypothetical protein [Candidatus Mycobacterium methanotrophicum]